MKCCEQRFVFCFTRVCIFTDPEIFFFITEAPQLPTDELLEPQQASLIFLCLLVFLYNSLLKLMRFSSQLSRNSTWTIGSNKSWDGEKQLVFELTVGSLFIFQKLTWKTKDVEKCTVRGKNSVSIIFQTHTHSHLVLFSVLGFTS